MRTRSFTAPAVLLTGALMLTACGGEDSQLEGKTGQEVVELAADALEEAGSVRLSGTMVEDGEETEIDLRLEGDDAMGGITVDGVEVQLISVDGAIYLEATEDVVSSFGLPAAIAAEVEGKWLQMPAAAAEDFDDFTLAGFLEELRSPGGDVKEETRSDEVDGESVVLVEQEDGSTLVVKDADPAYPLEMRAGGDAKGTLTFSDHGKKQDITAPSDVIDLEELVGG